MNDPAPAKHFQLVYASLIAPSAIMQLEAFMRAILLVSHRRNAADGVTGMLVSNGSWFVQVLEGPQAAVEACYARIEADDRHFSPTVRSRRAVVAPVFNRWSMCGLTLSPLEDALLEASDIHLNAWRASTGALMQLLTRVAERHGAELDALHAQLGADVSATNQIGAWSRPR